MATAQSCRLLHGTDTYTSWRTLKAIEARFLAKRDSMLDKAVYDLETTSLETLASVMRTVPFFVTHRLFILKHVGSASKGMQEGLVSLLADLPDGTYVVLYEDKSFDKRLSLYKWLEKHAKVEEYVFKNGPALQIWVRDVARGFSISLDASALGLLQEGLGEDSWQWIHEIKKLAAWVRSQGRDIAHKEDVLQLSSLSASASLFALTDALRDGKLREALSVVRQTRGTDDPMLIAGVLGGYVRTLAKIVVCYEQGITTKDAIAKAAKLNPYVVSLNLSLARQLSSQSLEASYAALIRFDESVKEGSVAPEAGLLLLILRLHGTFKRSMQGSRFA